MINERNARAFCNEDIAEIENYEQAVNDKTQTWHCHHRLEVQGKTRRTARELSMQGLYWNRPADELIFLTKSEHSKLHGIGNKHCLGRHLSDETRKKLSEIAKRRAPKSEETRKKMSMSLSGEKHPLFGKHRSEETRKKISMSRLGQHLSEETKKKCAAAFIGTHWWNNGIVSKQKRECPGEGWVRGRLKRK